MIWNQSSSQKSQGFSLIEIVVTVGIVLAVLTNLLVGIVFSLNNARYSREKSQSIKIVQKGFEWMQFQRDRLGWSSFYSSLESDDTNGDNLVEYCLTSLSLDPNYFFNLEHVESDFACPQNEDNPLYSRRVAITLNSDSDILMEIEVSWGSGNDSESTTLQKILANRK